MEELLSLTTRQRRIQFAMFLQSYFSLDASGLFTSKQVCVSCLLCFYPGVKSIDHVCLYPKIQVLCTLKLVLAGREQLLLVILAF